MYSILLMLHKDSDAACTSPRRGLEKLSTIGTSQRPWKALQQKEKKTFSLGHQDRSQACATSALTASCCPMAPSDGASWSSGRW